MSVAPFILTRPTYTLINSLILPIETVPADDLTVEPTLRGYLTFLFPVSILLDALMDEAEDGRSLGEEQFGVYESIERRLSAEYGVDGRSCILRFICELQRRPISQWTVAGQLLTVLFTPSYGGKKEDLELLMKYRAAQMLGMKDEIDCSAIYNKCPFSVFYYFDAVQNVTSSFRSDGKQPSYLWDY
ncbi:uncharacterized protein LOC135212116 [Macrobrachium nipponense]|uniref:uncharacterized protein LOC135212116 n=1 Tax=Macrobrachium nipponense TaxID=159736 RepID=UPI0030C85304